MIQFWEAQGTKEVWTLVLSFIQKDCCCFSLTLAAMIFLTLFFQGKKSGKRVSLDPHAVLLHASLEGELELVKSVIHQVGMCKPCDICEPWFTNTNAMLLPLARNSTKLVSYCKLWVSIIHQWVLCQWCFARLCLLLLVSYEYTFITNGFYQPPLPRKISKDIMHLSMSSPRVRGIPFTLCHVNFPAKRTMVSVSLVETWSTLCTCRVV